jgi:hypothetical protein
MAPPGIFCLEGEWDPDLRTRMSVEPVLELLERLGLITAIHRDVATKAELEYYLRKWLQPRYNNYLVLYLACHGSAAGIDLGHDEVSLAALADVLEDGCGNSTIYFGSCLAMDAPDDELKRFVARTGAKAMIGYSRAIDWLESAAFECLLLDRLAHGNRTDGLFNQLHRDHGAMAERLGLVAATRTNVYRNTRPRRQP